MSFNSLDSKTSPHSWHSTYSDSSSRETICTRGCLHSSGLTFCWGDRDGWLGVINLSTAQFWRGNVAFCPELAIFCGGKQRVVKYLKKAVVGQSDQTDPLPRKRTSYSACFGTKIHFGHEARYFWAARDRVRRRRDPRSARQQRRRLYCPARKRLKLSGRNYLLTCFGEALLRIASSRCADAGGATFPCRTISLALSSFPYRALLAPSSERSVEPSSDTPANSP